jgi:hypothetical protein
MPGEKRQDFEQYSQDKYKSLRSEYNCIVNKHPEADCALKQVHKALGDIVRLSGCTPSSGGECASWRIIIENAKQDRLNLCKALHWKCLCSVLVGIYTVHLTSWRDCYEEVWNPVAAHMLFWKWKKTDKPSPFSHNTKPQWKTSDHL